MSEFLQNNQKRIEELYQFATGIIKGQNGRELIDKHREAIDNVSPRLTIAMVDRVMRDEHETADIKKGINKVLNVFYKKLDKFRIDPPRDVPFVFYLMNENRALDQLLKGAKTHIKKINSVEEGTGPFNNVKGKLLDVVARIADYDPHYLKKENILFPYLEKAWPDYRCVNLMWSYHDDIRQSRNKLEDILRQDKVDLVAFNEEVGRLYFLIYTIMFREDVIVFPVAIDSVSAEDWQEMHLQSFEYGFPFIDAPPKPEAAGIEAGGAESEMNNSGTGMVNLETGSLNADQLISMLNALPVDITMVDENNRVKYFSSPKDRIFPRSKAVIGRSVENCHPPESVHIVEHLVEEMRSGKKDSERFWIQMKGRFILIDYYALRDEHGIYKGVIEVSQDISEIRKLDGEKRLMD